MPLNALLSRCKSICCVAYALLAGPTLALGQQPPQVQVSTPIVKRVVNWDEYTGRFEASEQVEVRARVSGFLEAVNFRDGQVVRKGDLLFTVDRRPYQLAADAARAEVARARAQVELTQNEVERADALTQNRTITARDVDQRRANLNGAAGALQGAEANLKSAELNLEWTEVRAPLAGRISNRRVDVGNLIAGGQSDATLLTTILASDPIYFVFDASEADFLRYSRLSVERLRADPDRGARAQVRLADESEWRREGRIDFFDNALNARSATIRGRAIFENKDQFLTPGTFGRLRLYAGETDAVLVPDAAISSDQANKVLMTIGPENKVVPKTVQLGALSDGLRIVVSGLSAQDKVIVGGLASPMVRPGVVVAPQPGEIKSAAVQ